MVSSTVRGGDATNPSSELDGSDLITVSSSVSASKVIANVGDDSLVISGRASQPSTAAAAMIRSPSMDLSLLVLFTVMAVIH